MNLSLYREVSAALGRRQPRTRGEAGTHVSLRLDSMHLRPEEGAPREWVHHWVQDSEPSMGPGTGVTEETDHAGYCGGSEKQGCSHEGKPPTAAGSRERGGSGRGALRLGKTTSYKTNAIIRGWRECPGKEEGASPRQLLAGRQVSREHPHGSLRALSSQTAGATAVQRDRGGGEGGAATRTLCRHRRAQACVPQAAPPPGSTRGLGRGWDTEAAEQAGE